MQFAIASRIPSSLEGTYVAKPVKDGLFGLSNLNLFCGPNNSGKSRLLREIFKQHAATQSLFIRSLVDSSSEYRQLFRGVRELAFNRLRQGNVFTNTADPYYRLLSDPNADSPIVFEFVIRMMLNDERLPEDFQGSQLPPRAKQDLERRFEDVCNQSRLDNDEYAVYIPAIRTCRDIGNADSIHSHIDTTYFRSANRSSNSEVATGRELYNSIRSHLLGPPRQRRAVARFEKLLGDLFFDGKLVSLVPREKSEALHIRIEPEQELAVAHLGDGLQHLVTILAPAFLNEGSTLFLFIEEPELYLHPGLQRRLAEVLLDLPLYTSWERCQVFATTHSNHLLDLTLDHDRISIFSLHKEAAQEPPDEPDRYLHEVPSKFTVHTYAGPDIEVLRLLGAQNSSVLLSNCTIWVEGPTDRRILNHYLSLHAEAESVDIREDLDYSFVYYGGSLLERWHPFDEDGPRPDRLCGNKILITDRDTENKRSRLDRLKEIAGESLFVLECREIENTIFAELVPKIASRLLRHASGDLGTAPTEEDLVSTGIGTILDGSCPAETKPRKWTAADEGLESRYKNQYADLVVELTTSKSLMSPAAKSVAQKLLAFVLEHKQSPN